MKSVIAGSGIGEKPPGRRWLPLLSGALFEAGFSHAAEKVVFENKKDLPCGEDGIINISDESLAIISLLHDLCKVNFYADVRAQRKSPLRGQLN